MMIFVYILTGLLGAFCLIRYPAYTWLLVAIITLQSFFRLINMDLVFFVPVISGVSLNFTDFMSLSAMLLLFFKGRNLGLSKQLRVLLYFFGISVIVVAVYSFLVLDASLGLVGNRFRSYMVYFMIPAIILLLREEKRFDYFIMTLMIISVAVVLVQVVEYSRGQPFIISGGLVLAKHALQFGQYEGVSRVWNRAMPAVMVIYAISVMGVFLDDKKRWLYGMLLVAGGIAIVLSLTRTLFIYGISVFLFSVVLISLKKSSNIMKGLMPAVVLISIIISVIHFSGFGDITSAVGARFGTIAPALFDENATSSMDAREEQFNQIIEYIRKSNIPPIFGVGITDSSIRAYTSDLGYINIVVNMGILGLFILIGWFYYMFTMSVRLWRMAETVKQKIVSGSVLVSIPGIMFTGINFDYFTGTYYFWLVAATVMLESISYQIASNKQPVNSQHQYISDSKGFIRKRVSI